MGGTGEGRKKGDDGEIATRDFGLGSLQYSNACSPDRIFKHRLETQSERISRISSVWEVRSQEFPAASETRKGIIAPKLFGVKEACVRCRLRNGG